MDKTNKDQQKKEKEEALERQTSQEFEEKKTKSKGVA